MTRRWSAPTRRMHQGFIALMLSAGALVSASAMSGCAGDGLVYDTYGVLTAPVTYAGRTYVFSERNWHDCDEHQRAVRSGRYKLIRTDAYAELPLCTAADIGASASFLDLRARAKAGRLTLAQRRLFEAPRARLELYDLVADPWEVRNVADDPAHAKQVRELAAVLEGWIEQSDDFPAAYRVRDDNTDRVTGVQFTTRIPLLRNPDVPPPDERWGFQGPK